MRQLEPDFAERVIDVIRRTDFEPRRLVLELTESVLIDPRGHAAASLATLRELGVRIAVDDFGTGFASISYLCHLPIDILKVDRSFVSNSGPGPQGEALLDAIVGLGHRLGLEVIPEGIEQVEQLSRLQALGCRTGQGFLLSRPMPPNGIATLLRHNAHVPSPRAVLSRVPVAARSLAASS
jgi:EAL domain-containing protein (putative c-di-GMP-specific phosphodiesterase class I)